MPDQHDFESLNRKLDHVLLQIEELRAELKAHLAPGDGLGATAQPLDVEQRRYGSDGDHIILSRVEAKLLERLMLNKGRLVPMEDLCYALGLTPSTQRRNVKSYVSKLRGKLRSMKNPGIEIVSSRGLGYYINVLGTEGDNDPHSDAA